MIWSGMCLQTVSGPTKQNLFYYLCFVWQCLIKEVVNLNVLSHWWQGNDKFSKWVSICQPRSLLLCDVLPQALQVHTPSILSANSSIFWSTSLMSDTGNVSDDETDFAMRVSKDSVAFLFTFGLIKVLSGVSSTSILMFHHCFILLVLVCCY